MGYEQQRQNRRRQSRAPGPAVRSPGPAPVTRRSLISTCRLEGTIVDWHGPFGWIEPLEPVGHPQARRHDGKVYVSSEDTDEDVRAVGTLVTFFAYADANGLGAMHVQCCNEEPSMALLPPEEERRRALAVGPYVAPPRERSESVHALAPRGGYRPSKPSRAANAAEVKDGLFTCFYRSVLAAAEPIAKLEEQWSQHELAKRVARYFCRAAAAPELLLMPWDEAARLFVDHAMQSYSAACSDRIWFFELDLASALADGIWELLKGACLPPRIGFQELERTVAERYEEQMDMILLDRAVYDSTSAVFGEGPLCTKIYKILYQARDPALQEARSTAGRHEDLRRVEVFVELWMQQSTAKVWRGMEQSEQLLTAEAVQKLFQNLVAPFGEDHPYSCVPMVLTRSIGRPPRSWAFLERTARRLYSEMWGSGVVGADEGFDDPDSPT